MRSKSRRRCYGVDGGCTEKNKNRDCCVYRWSNARVPSLTPTSSHASHFHSPFLPLCLSLPCPTYLTLLSIILILHLSNKHHQSPTLPYPPPPHTHTHLPHPTTPSRLHTIWRYPSSTISLNLVNHSHGRPKHHFS